MTLLNCLAAAIPARERVVTAEEVFELQVPLPDVVAMQTRQPNLEGLGEVRLRRLIKEALRMRPDRLMGGEMEGGKTSTHPPYEAAPPKRTAFPGVLIGLASSRTARGAAI